MTDKVDNATQPDEDVLEFERGTPLSLTTKALVFQAFVSAGMLGFALQGLTIESGPASNLKIALLTIASGVIAFVVNKIAIEQGADHAAKKSRLAAVSSVLAILSVGAGFYMLTYSGQVNVEVGELQAQAHATDLAFIRENSSSLPPPQVGLDLPSASSKPISLKKRRAKIKVRALAIEEMVDVAQLLLRLKNWRPAPARSHYNLNRVKRTETLRSAISMICWAIFRKPYPSLTRASGTEGVSCNRLMLQSIRKRRGF